MNGEMAEIDVKKELQGFGWEKLSKIRGGAHEGIIGGWISWWIEIDPENHLVFNPAPYVKDKSADIVFLRSFEDIYYPLGVAEIENNPDKWLEKLKTLGAYEKQYSFLESLRFLLLCVTTKSKDEERFRGLIEQTKNISKDSEVNWILYRLKKIPWKEDTCGILREDDEVWYYESISSGELFIIKNGEMVFHFDAEST